MDGLSETDNGGIALHFKCESCGASSEMRFGPAFFRALDWVDAP